MDDVGRLNLKIVDGLKLSAELRKALRPGEVIQDVEGRKHVLPRFLYEIDSWQTALNTELAPNFRLHEFISTDVREAPALRGFPRYVPLAVTHLAAHLALFRQQVGTYIHLAANGGYRSPSHQVSASATPHHWGTAANIYRIGDDYLDTSDNIQRYTEIARRVLPGMWVRPCGRRPGETIDHLHIDIGRYVLVPRNEATGEVVTGEAGQNGGASKEV